MYQVGLVAIIGSVYFIIAAIIFWRRSDDWPALFTATTLVTFGATFPGATEAILITRTGGQMPPSFYSVVGGIVFMIFFYSLFPDGRFVPTWTRYLAFGWVAFSFYSTLYPSSSLSIGTWYGSRQALILGWLAIGVGSQVYRYRRVSSPLQRQQTKWIVSGSLVGYSVAASFIFAILFIPDLGHTGRAMILYYSRLRAAHGHTCGHLCRHRSASPKAIRSNHGPNLGRGYRDHHPCPHGHLHAHKEQLAVLRRQSFQGSQWAGKQTARP